MPRRSGVLVAISLWMAVGVCGGQPAAYREDFPNQGEVKGAGDLPLNDSAIGWRGYAGNQARDFSANTKHFRVRNHRGPSGDFGVGQANSGGKGLVYSGEFSPIDRAEAEVESISFSLYTALPSDAVFVAVQVDVEGEPRWFVNVKEFSNEEESVWKNHTLRFPLDASSWRELAVDPGNSLEIQQMTFSELPEGKLLAAGLYMTDGKIESGGNDGNIRFDDFEIVLSR